MFFSPRPRDYRRPGYRPRPRPSVHLQHYKEHTDPYPIGNPHNHFEDQGVLIEDHDSDGVDFRCGQKDATRKRGEKKEL